MMSRTTVMEAGIAKLVAKVPVFNLELCLLSLVVVLAHSVSQKH